MTYKRTRELYISFARQFFCRTVCVYLVFHAAVTAVVCLCCALVIAQLYRFFSNHGVADTWYQLFVTLPIAMLAAPSLIKLSKHIMKFKRDYSRWMQELYLDGYDEETDAEVIIDDTGISFVNRKGVPQKLNWVDMTFGIAMKDFYVFMGDGELLVGIPKDAVGAELGEYLMNIIRRTKGKGRIGARGCRDIECR